MPHAAKSARGLSDLTSFEFARVKNCGGRGGRGPRERNQFQRPQISVMQAAPGMMLVPAEGAGPNGPFVQVPAPETGGDAPEGGQQQVVVVAEGKGGKVYQDIDAPKSNRVVLDYGDI